MNVLHHLEKDVFPLIGNQPIADIRAPVMLDEANSQQTQRAESDSSNFCTIPAPHCLVRRVRHRLQMSQQRRSSNENAADSGIPT